MNNIMLNSNNNGSLKEEKKEKEKKENTNEMGNFIRKSYKFLIRSDNLLEAKKLLDLNCNKYVFDKNIPATQLISSVYFDNEDFSSYCSRIIKNPDSICIRFRTYNNNYSKIYAECKTHKGYTIKTSSKERICLKQEDLNEFLSSRITYSESTSVIYDKINYYITVRKYVPKVKITYNRTSYYDNKIRLTLDENLMGYVANDNNSITSDSAKSAKSAKSPNSDTNIFKLDYSILEVKITDGESYNNIPYIKKLIDMGLVIEIPEFSKYLSVLYYFNANNLSIKPYWYDDFIKVINKTSEFTNIFSKPIDKSDLTKQTIYPIALKPNTFSSIESLYYKIFNSIVGIPFTLQQYDKLTGHTSFLLNPLVLKIYMIVLILLNLLTYCKTNNQLISRTINYMGTIFPALLAFILLMSIIF
jgi:SPX domain protein involved in polyphosphate accumulation